LDPLEIAPVRETHKVARDERKLWINEGRLRGMQLESYRSYKDTKRIFMNTQNSANYNYQSEVCREIDESAGCDIHLFWKLWKGHTKKKKHSIYKELLTNNIT
jgi:hypothetical protein